MIYFSIFLLKVIQLRFVYHTDVFYYISIQKKDSYKGILKKTLPMTSLSKSK